MYTAPNAANFLFKEHYVSIRDGMVNVPQQMFHWVAVHYESFV